MPSPLGQSRRPKASAPQPPGNGRTCRSPQSTVRGCAAGDSYVYDPHVQLVRRPGLFDHAHRGGWTQWHDGWASGGRGPARVRSHGRRLRPGRRPCRGRPQPRSGCHGRRPRPGLAVGGHQLSRTPGGDTPARGGRHGHHLWPPKARRRPVSVRRNRPADLHLPRWGRRRLGWGVCRRAPGPRPARGRLATVVLLERGVRTRLRRGPTRRVPPALPRRREGRSERWIRSRLDRAGSGSVTPPPGHAVAGHRGDDVPLAGPRTPGLAPDDSGSPRPARASPGSRPACSFSPPPRPW
jgi:hypothetical protein